MSLTKIVVVVDETRKEIFEGKNIEVQPSYGLSNQEDTLTIRQSDSDGKESREIAAFKEWEYWRYTD